MSEINISNVNENEFTELRMESEYNYLDLSNNTKRKNSFQINENTKLKFNKEYDKDNTEDDIDNDNDSHHSYCLSRPPREKDKDDKISFSTLMFYSLPSFGKMSCLVLLNINSTLYYESLGASLLYMSFFVTLTRCLELIVKPWVAHTSDEIRTKMGRRKPFMLIGCGFYALFLVLLFCPPTFRTSKRSLSIWFGIFFIFFFFF